MGPADDDDGSASESLIERPDTRDDQLASTRALDPTQRSPGGSMSEGEDAGLSVGSTVGRHRILAALGRGGMGVVYRAHDPELDRELAIKLLHLHDHDDPSRGRSLLMREARAMARVAHPNVIAVYDVGVHGQQVYVAMELVRGRSLGEWMRAGPSLAELLDMFGQAARGLAAAHRAGLVHHDFKPANVLVGDDKRVRVLDFGLARGHDRPLAWAGSAANGPLEITAPSLLGSLAGTPAYMSPEQIEAGKVDPRSDQFAFCVSLHEGLFGVRPFVGATLLELREAITRAPLRLPSAASQLPSALRELLFTGLAKHRSDRFDDMDALADRLDAIRSTLSREPAALQAVPLGRHHAPRGRPPPADSSLSRYLAGLPDGLDSHRHCEMHGATLRLALARHALDDDDELPEAARIGLALLDAADPQAPWIAEAPARAVLAALYDRRLRDLAAWDELWAAIARSRFTDSFLGFAMLRERATLARACARLWNDYHRGTTLEIEPRDDSLAVELRYPDGLLDALAHAEALQMVGVALQLGGHAHVEIVERVADSTRLRATIVVDPEHV